MVLAYRADAQQHSAYADVHYQPVDLSDGHNGPISSAALTPSCRLSEGTLALNLGNDPCRPQVFS